MASLDPAIEKKNFKIYYESNRALFNKAKNSYISLIKSILKRVPDLQITAVEGRVKDSEECLKKFKRKYQDNLENQDQGYEIKDFITDIIGIRIVCLYQDQVALASAALADHFTVIGVSDKIAARERTEDSFGYKSLHMDMRLNPATCAVKQREFAHLPFEVQIRSLIQDAWSVLDHKIKYKKSIPNDLKRRINVLSALFELADREFTEIRDATSALMEQEAEAPLIDSQNEQRESSLSAVSNTSGKVINAFNFLRVAGHFFTAFEFEEYKVDNFVQDILKCAPAFQKSDLHKSLKNFLKIVKDYGDDFLEQHPESSFSPYTQIRHCLYLYQQESFDRILSRPARDRFSKWLKKNYA